MVRNTVVREMIRVNVIWAQNLGISSPMTLSREIDLKFVLSTLGLSVEDINKTRDSFIIAQVRSNYYSYDPVLVVPY